MGRTGELVLGIIAGIFGILSGFFALAFGGLGAAFKAEGASYVILGGLVAIFVSILGIIGAAIVKRSSQWGGIMMLIAAVIGFLSISFFYVLSSILFGIAGCMAIFSKGETDE